VNVVQWSSHPEALRFQYYLIGMPSCFYINRNMLIQRAVPLIFVLSLVLKW
jgi:hypothetical protein